ncbi:MAG: hypothetical protein HY401_09010 [Elusimicrobia bacterium]|nr:hypothetical protein [Elusimicrobiota bacterium]
MKVKNITIGIKSLEEGLGELVETIKTIQKGKPPRTKKEGSYFVSLEAMRQVLTPKRLELLHAIRENHPESIYELAHLTKRDLKNVQDDLSLLTKVGLVSLSKKKVARERVIPRVDYDQLQLQIPVI